MASPAYANPGSDQIKLGPAPHVFALKFAQGKDVISKFPGGRVMFTAVDERKLFLNDEDANEFEHALVDLQIQPAEFIRVSRITHGRGGGFAIRVERVEDPDAPAPPSRLEAQLAASIPLARAHGAAAFVTRIEAQHAAHPEVPSFVPGRETERAAPARAARTQRAGDSPDSTAPAPPASGAAPMSGVVAGALCAAIDACAIAASYGRTKGLDLVFTSEDVRTCAATMLIQYWRDGGTR